MASTDAKATPLWGVAHRAIFPILDADGDLVTGATGLDSEVSKDQGTFADCTNEATEIATSSGMYYLDLTATEMEADCVSVIVKTSSVGAKTTTLVLYTDPGTRTRKAQAGANGTVTLDSSASATDDFYNDQLVRIVGGTGAGQARLISDYVGSTKVASVVPNWATNPDSTSIFQVLPGGRVDVGQWVDSAPNTLVSGRIDSSVGAMASDVLTAAAIATGAIDADAIADNAIDAGAIAANAITSAKIAADAIGGAQLAADAVAEIQSGLATASALSSVQSDTDNIQTRLPAALVGGRMDSDVGNLQDGTITAAKLAGDAITAAKLAADVGTEIATAVWAALTASHIVAGSFGERFQTIRRFTNNSPGSGDAIAFDAGASAVDGFYDNCLALVVSGVGAGQMRRVLQYNGTLKSGQVVPDWATTIDATSVILLIPDGAANVGAWKTVPPLNPVGSRPQVYLSDIDPIITAVIQSGLATSAQLAAGLTLTTAERLAVADALLKRDLDTVEGSAAIHSLCTALLKLVSRFKANSGGNAIVYRTNGTTEHARQAVTNDPITAISELGAATP